MLHLQLITHKFYADRLWKPKTEVDLDFSRAEVEPQSQNQGVSVVFFA
jgi:hypothetical protein